MKYLRIPEVVLFLFVVTLAALWMLPNVLHRLRLAKLDQARSEMTEARLGIQKMLSDLGAESLFELAPLEQGITFEEAVARHSELCRSLLREGRHTSLPIPARIKKNLAESYLQLGKDPWGNGYRFIGGPKAELEKLGLRVPVAFDPSADDDAGPRAGPDDERVYVFSLGPNGKMDQVVTEDQGDDLAQWMLNNLGYF
jgi:hypothetical protein